MRLTINAATFTTADALELNAIGDAIFAEWFPNHRPGDPISAHLPLHIQRETDELTARHRMVAALRRGQRAA